MIGRMMSTQGKRDKTYADFLAYITSDAGITQANGAQAYPSPNTILVSNIGDYGTMWGSSWAHRFTDDSTLSRIIQHALPSLEIFQDQIANSRKVILILESYGSVNCASRNRNGYLSEAYTTYTCNVCTKITYWNNLLGKAFYLNPYASGTATEFIY